MEDVKISIKITKGDEHIFSRSIPLVGTKNEKHHFVKSWLASELLDEALETMANKLKLWETIGK